MPSASSLFVSFVAGAFGVAYFIYGKKQEKLGFLAAGVALCVYPYLVGNLPLEILIGGALLAAPFLVNI